MHVSKHVRFSFTLGHASIETAFQIKNILNICFQYPECMNMPEERVALEGDFRMNYFLVLGLLTRNHKLIQPKGA